MEYIKNYITKDRLGLVKESVRRATDMRIELSSHSEDDSIKMRGKLPLIFEVNFASCGSMPTDKARNFANQLVNATMLADQLTALHINDKWDDDDDLRTAEDYDKVGKELTEAFKNGDWCKLLTFAVAGLKEVRQ